MDSGTGASGRPGMTGTVEFQTGTVGFQTGTVGFQTESLPFPAMLAPARNASADRVPR